MPESTSTTEIDGQEEIDFLSGVKACSIENGEDCEACQ